jgi:hypothetical protein
MILQDILQQLEHFMVNRAVFLCSKFWVVLSITVFAETIDVKDHGTLVHTISQRGEYD